MTSTNPGVISLMVKPLSKRAQLLSPSILIQAMFLDPLHQVCQLVLRKRTFWDISRLWKLHPGMLVEWLLVSEGSTSLFWCPHFLGSLAEILQEIFHQMVRTITSEAISVFLWYSSTTLAKMDGILNGLIISTNPTQGFWVLFTWRLSIFCL